MNKQKIFILFGFLFLLGITISAVLKVPNDEEEPLEYLSQKLLNSPTPTQIPLPPLPTQKLLPNDYHVFQTFNNCGPAAFSMALSYYGITVSQQELGRALRPYQNPQGDNDDKSTTLEELAEMSKDYGFIPYLRPAGNAELVKQFISNDMPVITRTLLDTKDDIGHYRVIKGYDDTTGEFIQDDSLQGKNLRYSYSEFDVLWKQFGYEYLVLVPTLKGETAKAILGQDVDPAVAWQRAADRAFQSDDTNSRFNRSVALYHLGDYEGSVQEFEQVEGLLSFRTLWYQIEPILAYVALGDDDRVLSLTQQVLNNQNRAFSELYIIRGDIFKKRGDIDSASSEYQKAVQYNINLQAAKAALASIE